MKIVSFPASKQAESSNEDALLMMYYHTGIYCLEWKIWKIHKNSLKFKILKEQFNNFSGSIRSSRSQMFFKIGILKILKTPNYFISYRTDGRKFEGTASSYGKEYWRAWRKTASSAPFFSQLLLNNVASS